MPEPVTPTSAAGPTPAGSGRQRAGDPAVLQRLSIASLVMVVLIMVTGAAVRLTDSGLGCSDWPTCSKGHLTPPLQFHSLVEFSNRMVTILMVVVVGVTFVVAWLRRPRRNDLLWLSGGLVGGVLLQAVLGGIVVYTKLNPYLVMVHFSASTLLIVDAVVLVHRGRRDFSKGSGRLLVPRPVLLGTRGLLALFAVVIAAGTATSGAGPHAGGSNGQQVAKRLPVALRQMAELHSSLALLTVGLAVGLAVSLHAIDVPERVRKSSRILVLVLVLQAAVGYTQYFTHLPALLVEVHVAGATVLVVGITQFFLSLTFHPLERTDAGGTGGVVGPSAADAGGATRSAGQVADRTPVGG